MSGATLVGVGVGPGDPELVTVKAVRVLREADLVLVPVTGTGEQGRAEATVRAHVDHDRIRRVVFALDGAADRARREDAWDTAADAVLRAFGAGASVVAFATIGDPNVYSTFTYLAATVAERFARLAGQPGGEPSAGAPAARRHGGPVTQPPGDPAAKIGALAAGPGGGPAGPAPARLTVRTVPGITAMQDLAARSGTVLCEGTETLALLPLTAGLERFAEALASFDTVVGYKSGRHLPEVLAAVRDAGRLPGAVHGASLGLPGEDIRPAAEVTGPAPYLSTLLVPGKRSGRGGKL
ncbi:MAG TPA: precorrin-2 C(20)-methyltransferase [Streptosporangiaceae bacterium]